MDILTRLKALLGESNVLDDEPMKNHTSFRTGGNADYFILPENEEDIKKAIRFLKKEEIKYYIFGNGSNMLVSDKGIEGAVIKIGNAFSDIKVNGTEMIIGSGALLSSVANIALNNSLTGFEFASGIPGSFGGAVFMNAGAYGPEIKDVIKWVKVIDDKLETKVIYKEDMGLGYRTSNFQKNGYIILEGAIELEKGVKEDISVLMNELNSRRRDKQPLNFASAGSTFKRPEGHFAGKLIEDCGLKGKTVGGAMVSEKHAGFVVNTGNATTDDILSVMEICKKEVKEKFLIDIEPEVRFIGRV